jgi:osmoprotectant transport system permease protein
MKLLQRILVGICLALILIKVSADSTSESNIIIGSKKFTESVILAEIATQIIEDSGVEVSHLSGLGGTRILWSALLAGEISAYPEYTGTLIQEIFSEKKIDNFAQLETALAEKGIGVTSRLGFNNTYIIGMRESRAEELSISKISDLKLYPDLKFAFSNEFMDRGDGWPALRQQYQLPQVDVRGVDHDLAYRGLESGSIDAMDLYSTDAEIEYYKIRSLLDDQKYFSDYHAVYLYRLDQKRILGQQLQRVSGHIDNDTMVAMNAAVKIAGRKEQSVAASFVKNNFAIESSLTEISIYDRFLKNSKDHLILVAISLFAAICFAIPLGILAARRPLVGQVILATAGILQTIPSLALFVFLIPLLGIGGPPTIVALFIYSLLPIIRNTYSGLHDIPAPLRESAQAIGLPPVTSLKIVELPLATRSILSGIKTSAVINVGTATLGALIGAGGFGQPILTGIRLDDTSLILEGAIPAAVLALLVQALFELFERVLLPLPLRYQVENKQA